MGLRLILEHPQVAFRDCDHCQKYQYDETTGKVKVWRGEPLERSGLPPCRYGKCPKGTPENPNTLKQHNVMAYVHYLECRAVGNFPDDPICRRTARIVRSVEDGCERTREVNFHNIMQIVAMRHG